MTYGLVELSKSNPFPEPVSVSESSPAISSLKISFSSAVPRYLSRSTRSSILLIILIVVATPTSLLTNTSSRSSKTSSSTVDLPATALLILERKVVLDFSSPLSKVSFFSLENIFLNKLISIGWFFLAEIKPRIQQKFMRKYT